MSPYSSHPIFILVNFYICPSASNSDRSLLPFRLALSSLSMIMPSLRLVPVQHSLPASITRTDHQQACVTIHLLIQYRGLRRHFAGTHPAGVLQIAHHVHTVFDTRVIPVSSVPPQVWRYNTHQSGTAQADAPLSLCMRRLGHPGFIAPPTSVAVLLSSVSYHPSRCPPLWDLATVSRYCCTVM